MRAAVVPGEMAMSATKMAWWSERRDCKSVWTDFCFDQTTHADKASATAELAQAAVRQAMDAGYAYFGGFGLPFQNSPGHQSPS